jgi:anti-sigma factor RsiW
MSCDDARPLLALYHDGELDPVRALEIEHHLRDCDSCRSILENLRALGQATASAYLSAPPDLHDHLLAAINEAEPTANVIQLPRRSRSWLTSGLALAAAVVLGFFLGRVLERPTTNRALLAQLTDSHLRSLMGNHLTDVATSDQHTVRPWFEGKLDFAPPVEDLSAEGFPLVGGRVEYIGGRAVAALVYQRRQHFLNLFIWPEAAAEQLTTAKPQRGYNVIHWSSNGMAFWAVSEISEEELRVFGRDFAARR